MHKLLGGLAVTLALTACGAPPAPPSRQCNPVFTRGDIVSFKGIPESRFVVLVMAADCTVGLRNKNGTWVDYIGTDLLEKAKP